MKKCDCRRAMQVILAVLVLSGAMAFGFPPGSAAVESMPGGPPIPLIAVPEDFFFRVVPSAERLLLLAPSSSFNINYIAGGTNDFGDTCVAWPAEARTAFDFAAGVWATYLQSAVPITINACWATNLATGELR